MSKRTVLDRLKPLLKMLAASFAGAFIGAVWIAYLAFYMQVTSPVWLILSGVGAFVGGVVMSVLCRQDVKVRQLLKH